MVEYHGKEWEPQPHLPGHRGRPQPRGQVPKDKEEAPALIMKWAWNSAVRPSPPTNPTLLVSVGAIFCALVQGTTCNHLTQVHVSPLVIKSSPSNTVSSDP
eukprot:TRINITY_DN5857_c0_g1_i1.p4 TRINITY_DN5857_c0_g1~~TRINITY_DN5857_c0_g1_i1.p4  ORF type:complete len:101 (-),score=7.18 TRINITY_DN5857_c0_g1_i1:1803-2105(-)